MYLCLSTMSIWNGLECSISTCSVQSTSSLTIALHYALCIKALAIAYVTYCSEYAKGKAKNQKCNSPHRIDVNILMEASLVSRRLLLNPDEVYTVCEADGSDEATSEGDILNYDDLDDPDAYE